MSWRVRTAPALLLHVSLLLTMLSGAGLATAARLKWDPTTYVALRELFPLEYRVCGAALFAASLATLALAHLAALALALPARRAAARRAMLLTHAAVTAALVAAQGAWVGWTAWRVARWCGGALQEAGRARAQAAPLLEALARVHPLGGRVRALLAEAEADAPRNLHVAGAALVLAALLQPAAALLAALNARRTPPRTPPRRYSPPATSCTSADTERVPLRTAYKNGKLMIL